jgi:hypothetical protein
VSLRIGRIGLGGSAPAWKISIERFTQPLRDFGNRNCGIGKKALCDLPILGRETRLRLATSGSPTGLRGEKAGASALADDGALELGEWVRLCIASEF